MVSALIFSADITNRCRLIRLLLNDGVPSSAFARVNLSPKKREVSHVENYCHYQKRFNLIK
jgi:hypothetical protein